MSAWVPSGFFLPQSKDRQLRLIGDSKLPAGVSPEMNWRPAREPGLHPMSAGISSSILHPE